MTRAKPFATEAELCAAFLTTVPDGWTAYAETAGWDILLAHASGPQIGIEAKLVLTAHVIAQAIDDVGRWWRSDGPDFRAVLVPEAVRYLPRIAAHIGITVITMRPRVPYEFLSGNESPRWWSIPRLPPVVRDRENDWWAGDDWADWAPVKRVRLPDVVPDVVAGASAPLQLSHWKVGAIRICVLIERRGTVCADAFRAVKVSPRRWIDSGWVARGPARGLYVRGERFPADGFRAQHPRAYAEIEASFDAWAAGVPLPPGDLLGEAAA